MKAKTRSQEAKTLRMLKSGTAASAVFAAALYQQNASAAELPGKFSDYIDAQYDTESKGLFISVKDDSVDKVRSLKIDDSCFQIGGTVKQISMIRTVTPSSINVYDNIGCDITEKSADDINKESEDGTGSTLGLLSEYISYDVDDGVFSGLRLDSSAKSMRVIWKDAAGTITDKCHYFANTFTAELSMEDPASTLVAVAAYSDGECENKLAEEILDTQAAKDIEGIGDEDETGNGAGNGSGNGASNGSGNGANGAGTGAGLDDPSVRDLSTYNPMDVDGDGIPDLYIGMNKDGVFEILIDNDGDGVPDSVLPLGVGNNQGNGAGNGASNGAGNGSGNGASNGSGNGASNGSGNGAGNGSGSGSVADAIDSSDLIDAVEDEDGHITITPEDATDGAKAAIRSLMIDGVCYTMIDGKLKIERSANITLNSVIQMFSDTRCQNKVGEKTLSDLLDAEARERLSELLRAREDENGDLILEQEHDNPFMTDDMKIGSVKVGDQCYMLKDGVNFGKRDDVDEDAIVSLYADENCTEADKIADVTVRELLDLLDEKAADQTVEGSTVDVMYDGKDLKIDRKDDDAKSVKLIDSETGKEMTANFDESTGMLEIEGDELIAADTIEVYDDVNGAGAELEELDVSDLGIKKSARTKDGAAGLGSVTASPDIDEFLVSRANEDDVKSFKLTDGSGKEVCHDFADGELDKKLMKSDLTFEVKMVEFYDEAACAGDKVDEVDVDSLNIMPKDADKLEGDNADVMYDDVYDELTVMRKNDDVKSVALLDEDGNVIADSCMNFGDSDSVTMKGREGAAVRLFDAEDCTGDVIEDMSLEGLKDGAKMRELSADNADLKYDADNDELHVTRTNDDVKSAALTDMNGNIIDGTCMDFGAKDTVIMDGMADKYAKGVRLFDEEGCTGDTIEDIALDDLSLEPMNRAVEGDNAVATYNPVTDTLNVKRTNADVDSMALVDANGDIIADSCVNFDGKNSLDVTNMRDRSDAKAVRLFDEADCAGNALEDLDLSAIDMRPSDAAPVSASNDDAKITYNPRTDALEVERMNDDVKSTALVDENGDLIAESCAAFEAGDMAYVEEVTAKNASKLRLFDDEECQGGTVSEFDLAELGLESAVGECPAKVNYSKPSDLVDFSFNGDTLVAINKDSGAVDALRIGGETYSFEGKIKLTIPGIGSLAGVNIVDCNEEIIAADENAPRVTEGENGNTLYNPNNDSLTVERTNPDVESAAPVTDDGEVLTDACVNFTDGRDSALIEDFSALTDKKIAGVNMYDEADCQGEILETIDLSETDLTPSSEEGCPDNFGGRDALDLVDFSFNGDTLEVLRKDSRIIEAVRVGTQDYTFDGKIKLEIPGVTDTRDLQLVDCNGNTMQVGEEGPRTNISDNADTVYDDAGNKLDVTRKNDDIKSAAPVTEDGEAVKDKCVNFGDSDTASIDLTGIEKNVDGIRFYDEEDCEGDIIGEDDLSALEVTPKDEEGCPTELSSGKAADAVDFSFEGDTLVATRKDSSLVDRLMVEGQEYSFDGKIKLTIPGVSDTRGIELIDCNGESHTVGEEGIRKIDTDNAATTYEPEEEKLDIERKNDDIKSAAPVNEKGEELSDRCVNFDEAGKASLDVAGAGERIDGLNFYSEEDCEGDVLAEDDISSLDVVPTDEEGCPAEIAPAKLSDMVDFSFEGDTLIALRKDSVKVKALEVGGQMYDFVGGVKLAIPGITDARDVKIIDCNDEATEAGEDAPRTNVTDSADIEYRPEDNALEVTPKDDRIQSGTPVDENGDKIDPDLCVDFTEAEKASVSLDGMDKKPVGFEFYDNENCEGEPIIEENIENLDVTPRNDEGCPTELSQEQVADLVDFSFDGDTLIALRKDTEKVTALRIADETYDFAGKAKLTIPGITDTRGIEIVDCNDDAKPVGEEGPRTTETDDAQVTFNPEDNTVDVTRKNPDIESAQPVDENGNPIDDLCVNFGDEDTASIDLTGFDGTVNSVRTFDQENCEGDIVDEVDTSDLDITDANLRDVCGNLEFTGGADELVRFELKGDVLEAVRLDTDRVEAVRVNGQVYSFDGKTKLEIPGVSAETDPEILDCNDDVIRPSDLNDDGSVNEGLPIDECPIPVPDDDPLKFINFKFDPSGLRILRVDACVMCLDLGEQGKYSLAGKKDIVLDNIKSPDELEYIGIFADEACTEKLSELLRDDDVDGPEGATPGDIDGDGIPDDQDDDIDGDGIPNGQDDDVDGDGIPNGQDDDVDGDGIPNGQDDDIDGDGIPNAQDDDMDGDGIPNDQDDDIDGDGIPNDQDSTPNGGGTVDASDALPDAACEDAISEFEGVAQDLVILNLDGDTLTAISKDTSLVKALKVGGQTYSFAGKTKLEIPGISDTSDIDIIDCSDEVISSEDLNNDGSTAETEDCPVPEEGLGADADLSELVKHEIKDGNLEATRLDQEAVQALRVDGQVYSYEGKIKLVVPGYNGQGFELIDCNGNPIGTVEESDECIPARPEDIEGSPEELAPYRLEESGPDMYTMFVTKEDNRVGGVSLAGQTHMFGEGETALSIENVGIDTLDSFQIVGCDGTILNEYVTGICIYNPESAAIKFDVNNYFNYKYEDGGLTLFRVDNDVDSYKIPGVGECTNVQSFEKTLGPIAVALEDITTIEIYDYPDCDTLLETMTVVETNADAGTADAAGTALAGSPEAEQNDTPLDGGEGLNASPFSTGAQETVTLQAGASAGAAAGAAAGAEAGAGAGSGFTTGGDVDTREINFEETPDSTEDEEQESIISDQVREANAGSDVKVCIPAGGIGVHDVSKESGDQAAEGEGIALGVCTEFDPIKPRTLDDIGSDGTATEEDLDEEHLDSQTADTDTSGAGSADASDNEEDDRFGDSRFDCTADAEGNVAEECEDGQSAEDGTDVIDAYDYDEFLSDDSEAEPVDESKVQLGDLTNKWAPMTLSVTAPVELCSDIAELDGIELHVRYTHTDSEMQYVVPGYFRGGAAGGEADDCGTLWKVIFTPPMEGEWTYRIYLSGAEGGIEGLDNTEGTVTVGGARSEGLYGKGFLTFRENSATLLMTGEHPHVYEKEKDAAMKDSLFYISGVAVNSEAEDRSGILGELEAAGLSDSNMIVRTTMQYFTEDGKLDVKALDKLSVTAESLQQQGLGNNGGAAIGLLLDGLESGAPMEFVLDHMIARFGNLNGLIWMLPEGADASAAQYLREKDMHRNPIAAFASSGMGDAADIVIHTVENMTEYMPEKARILYYDINSAGDAPDADIWTAAMNGYAGIAIDAMSGGFLLSDIAKEADTMDRLAQIVEAVMQVDATMNSAMFVDASTAPETACAGKCIVFGDTFAVSYLTVGDSVDISEFSERLSDDATVTWYNPETQRILEGQQQELNGTEISINGPELEKYDALIAVISLSAADETLLEPADETVPAEEEVPAEDADAMLEDEAAE